MKARKTIIGLCGSSGSGKTQTCKKLVKVLRGVNKQCCGFVSPAVFEGSKKTAIKVQWLESGDERVLMTPVTEESQLTVGRWQIHQDAFEWIDQKLSDLKECRAFFCDEIGPLEVEQGKGWIKALEIADKRKYSLNVVTFRPTLRDYFCQRYPDMMIYDLESEFDDERIAKDVKEIFGIA
jgi:nucleoside-triphosphatase THEP1